MEAFLSEKQLVEKLRETDAEIEELKKKKQDYISKVKELEAKVVSLGKFAISAHSSSHKTEKPLTSHLANLPARPSSPEKKQQLASLSANLPARLVFTDFEIPGVGKAPQLSLFASTVSPQMLPPWSTPMLAGREPRLESIVPLNLPTRLRGRPKGTVPPLLPHHQSFSAGWGLSPSSIAPNLFQNLGVPNASSGDTSGSACFSPSTTEGNSYYHGPTFPYFPLPMPPVSSSTAMLSTIPASFDFNQQDGRQP